ncbi:hypothetical protein PanWU01x14_008320 [Parasponia andersonii]|uniref:Uncharacterized protein n=1 Tax=Parasponia andersonii TaxID=3476 RepID=A0A2P5E233_PARAD|nr:hypothetical protein PanWU01x14_008320 [Parasponia andersonii]
MKSLKAQHAASKEELRVRQYQQPTSPQEAIDTMPWMFSTLPEASQPSTVAVTPAKDQILWLR